VGGVDPVKTAFVDTSGFYAFLDRDDRFHAEAKRLFLKPKTSPIPAWEPAPPENPTRPLEK
jgi:hypothetical protein